MSGRPNSPRIARRVLVHAVATLRMKALIDGERELDEDLGAILKHLHRDADYALAEARTE